MRLLAVVAVVGCTKPTATPAIEPPRAAPAPDTVSWAFATAPAGTSMIVLDARQAASTRIGRALINQLTLPYRPLVDHLHACDPTLAESITAAALVLPNPLEPGNGVLAPPGVTAVALRGMERRRFDACLTHTPAGSSEVSYSTPAPTIEFVGAWRDASTVVIRPTATAPRASTWPDSMLELRDQLPSNGFLWALGVSSESMQAYGIDRVFYAYERNGRAQYYGLHFDDSRAAEAWADARRPALDAASADPSSNDYQSKFHVDVRTNYVVLMEEFSDAKLESFIKSIE